MVITVAAVYEDGVLKPKHPVPLEDKAEVRVVIETIEPSPPVDDADPTGWDALNSLIGIIDNAPPDMAENHDHYLYGFPRR